MKILITGVAGFIGMHVAKCLLERGDTIIGLDNINNFYSKQLKLARLKELKKFKKFSFYKVNIVNKKAISKIFLDTKPKKVIHLAAQAGVRYSINNPEIYIKSNLNGFANIIENCRNFAITDAVNGYFAIKSSLLKKIDLNKVSSNFFFEEDFLFQLSFQRIYIKEIPIKTIYHKMDNSNLSPLKTIIPFLFNHIKNFIFRIYVEAIK